MYKKSVKLQNSVKLMHCSQLTKLFPLQVTDVHTAQYTILDYSKFSFDFARTSSSEVILLMRGGWRRLAQS